MAGKYVVNVRCLESPICYYISCTELSGFAVTELNNLPVKFMQLQWQFVCGLLWRFIIRFTVYT
jgi:hypothetical protein